MTRRQESAQLTQLWIWKLTAPFTHALWLWKYLKFRIIPPGLCPGSPLVLSSGEPHVRTEQSRAVDWHINYVNIAWILQSWPRHSYLSLFSLFSLCKDFNECKTGGRERSETCSWDARKILVRLWLKPKAGMPDKRCIYILKRSLWGSVALGCV